MKGQIVWQEKDGTTFGPMNCEVEMPIHPLEEFVHIPLFAVIEDVKIAVFVQADVEKAAEYAEWLKVKRNHHSEAVPDLPEEDGIYWTWTGSRYLVAIRDSGSNPKLNYATIMCELTKNDARIVSHAIKESIDLLDRCGGSIDPKNVDRYMSSIHLNIAVNTLKMAEYYLGIKK